MFSYYFLRNLCDVLFKRVTSLFAVWDGEILETLTSKSVLENNFLTLFHAL